MTYKDNSVYSNLLISLLFRNKIAANNFWYKEFPAVIQSISTEGNIDCTMFYPLNFILFIFLNYLNLTIFKIFF